MPSSDTHTQTLASPSTSASPILRKSAARRPPWYYRLIITGLKPIYRAQVWRRSHQRDNYQQEVAQRFGKQYPPIPTTGAHKKTIWCHAVSLGETNTVAPLLDALLANGYQIWLTNTTQTGFARGSSRFAEEIASGRMSHSYVPVDSPAVIAKFLAHVQPIAALFVETELWANILTALSEQHIPSILVNGRLSAASFTRYQKIAAVSASMMQNLTLIIAQDSDSAKRFRQLGADSAKIRVAGSLKWVINTPKNAHTQTVNATAATQNSHTKIDALLTSSHRPIWVAASTHSEEEAIALSWQQQLLASPALKDSLLIIVPRHPERFDEVAALITESGLQMARRSLDEAIAAHTQVYLADTMGELMQWYAAADVALVGGSLVAIGGHNPVEPASVATPILMGQYTQSCQSVVDKLAEVGALYQPHNVHYQALTQPASTANKVEVHANDEADLIYQQLRFWLMQPSIAQRAGQAGAQLTTEQQDILTRQLAMIETLIERYVSYAADNQIYSEPV